MLGDFHCPRLHLTVPVYSQPGLPIGQPFKLDPDLQHNWRSRPSPTLFLSLFLPHCTHQQHPNLNITCLAQTKASSSNIHPITYPTCFILSELPSTTCNCIIMLALHMYIHFQLTVMAPKSSSKEKEKAKAKMPTSVINRRPLLVWDCIKGFMSECICVLILICYVCGLLVEYAWDIIYDIIILDSVKTRHLSEFQQMIP